MALHIDDPEIERRIRERSAKSGLSPEEVVRLALDAEDERVKARYEEILSFLDSKVWPNVPPDQLGKRLTKEEEEALLGYGPGEY